MILEFLSDCLNVLVWIACVVVGGVFVGVGVRVVSGLLLAAWSDVRGKCGAWVASVFLSVALVCTVVAQKDGGAYTNAPSDDVSGTNAVTQVEGGTNDWANIEGTNSVGQTNGGGTDGALSFTSPLMLRVRMRSLSSGLPPQDPPTVEPFAVRPANAVENHWWRGRGAHVDGFTIPAEGWNFRTSSGFLGELLVYSYGEIQPDVETAYFPRPFPEADLSLLPEGRWGMLPHEGAESLFWHATSPSNSLILTWQNAAYDRDANCPTNLQIELFSNGTYVYRYDDHTEHHAVEYPFDLDGDGLENSIDPDPLTPGNDAHGTNAEWYDLVCSDVFSKTEQPNSLPIPLPGGESMFFKPGVNTNAYYFVDVVVRRGPAPIYFNSSHPGRLGSPVVVALAGETNRVPLLVGATYSVTSDVPFTVACPTNGFAEVAWDDGVNATVRWPLNFTFTEELSGTGRSYTVGVEPYDPGGTFTWGHEHGGATLQSFSPLPNEGSACGCVSGNGTTVTFGCSSTCTCGGNCLAVGAFNMEQAVFSVTGGVCRCGFDDPGIEYAFPPSEESGPYVHISFSHPAVLFESAYETSPRVTMPRRSTRVRLVVEAYGGPNGCVLNLSEINMSKLVQIWGPNFQGPLSRQLAIGESYFMTCLFEGVEESFISNDVVVTGQIVDDVTATELSSSDELTVFRLEITPQHLAPSNTCPHRHELGCFELVNCQHFPRLTNFNWELVGGTTNLNSPDGGVEMSSANAVLRCPMTNSTARLSATFQDVRYYPQICFVEPRDIVAEKVDYRFPESRNPGDTGAVALKMWLYVHPKTVNFEELSFVEVPWSQGGFASGFFERPDQQRNRYHDENHGAGQWHAIGHGNYWGVDFVGSRAITNWCSGTLVWDIPIGWHGKNDSPTTPVVKIIGTPTTFQRRVEISETGTYSVEKFGHRLSREAVLPTESDNKNVILDGQERDLQEDLKRFLKEVDTEEQIWIF